LRSFWRMRIPKTKLLKKGLLSLTSISQVRRFVEKERIDVLLVYNLPQAPLLSRVDCRTHFDLADDLVAMMGLEQGLIARAGGTSMARAIQNRMLAQADTVTVASSVLAEQMNRPVLMLPNGADVKELDQADSREWRSRKLGPTAGFVGAFEYWVDFDLVLQIAQRLPHVTFLLVGGGRRLEQVKRQVERMGLTNMHLTGALPYSQAWMFACCHSRTMPCRMDRAR
jgi:glycosyltransferase involved in cell wall biosynthesis